MNINLEKISYRTKKIAFIEDRGIIGEGLKSTLKITRDTKNGIFKMFDDMENFMAYNHVERDLILVGSRVKQPAIAIGDIVENNPDAKIIIFLSVNITQEDLVSILTDGIAGYLFENAKRDVVSKAIFNVMAGRKYFPDMMHDMLFLEKGISVKKVETEKEYSFTPRQIQILDYLWHANSPKEIATKLNIKVGTVNAHKGKMYREANVHTFAEFLNFALVNKIINA